MPRPPCIGVQRLALAILAVVPILLAGCSEGGAGGGAGPPAVEEIAMHNRMYAPSAVTITYPTTLRFAAHDTTHTAQTADGQHTTGDVPQGESRDIPALPVGTYVFQCKYHAQMRLTVTVQE